MQPLSSSKWCLWALWLHTFVWQNRYTACCAQLFTAYTSCIIFEHLKFHRFNDSSFRFLQTLRTPPWWRPQKTGRNWSGLIRMWKECDGKLINFYDKITGWAMKVLLMLSLSDAFVLESQMPSEWPGKHCSLCDGRSSVCTHWAGSLHGSFALPGVCGVTHHPHSDLCYGSAPA